MSASTRSAIKRLEAQELPTAAVWHAATSQLNPKQLIDDITSGLAAADTSTARPARYGPTSMTPPRPGSRRIRVVIGGAVVAAVMVLAVVVVPNLFGGGTASAVTPSPLSFTPSAAVRGSSTLLAQLAAVANRQPPTSGAGNYTYTKIQSWDLTSNQDVNGNTISAAVVPTVRETWAAPDGSGLEVRSNPLRPGSSNQELAPGTPVVYQNLPTDPVALKQLLAQTHPDRGTYEWFVAFTDVWGVGRPVPPAVQGALLNLLAGEPDITVLGTTVDRAGRSGIAVSTDTTAVGFRQQNILIFDTSTGRLLSAEQVALTNSSSLPVTAPATIGYAMWLAAAKVATAGSRP